VLRHARCASTPRRPRAASTPRRASTTPICFDTIATRDDDDERRTLDARRRDRRGRRGATTTLDAAGDAADAGADPVMLRHHDDPDVLRHRRLSPWTRPASTPLDPSCFDTVDARYAPIRGVMRASILLAGRR
jgi:hypothetical protein